MVKQIQIPYVDGTSNNEAENINTKTVKRGAKLYFFYQVWLDTTKFDADPNKDNIQSVSITLMTSMKLRLM